MKLGFENYFEFVYENYTDEFYENQGWFAGSELEKKWIATLYTKEICPTQSARIIERTFKLYRL